MDRIGFVSEPARLIPVSADADIVVAGGGTAGVCAAVAAARSGMDVMIIEQFGSLGGSAANGLVTPFMHTGIEGNPLCSSISAEINQRMIDLGYGAVDCCNNSGYFDPVVLKYVLEEIAVNAGVRLLYYTVVSGAVVRDKKLEGVIIENKAGRSAVTARRFIDCTGDGDLCVKAGVPFEKGNPETGKNQPISVRYVVSGINLEEFSEFIQTYDSSFRYQKPFFYAAFLWKKGFSLDPVFSGALQAGDITFEDGAYWQIFGIPGRDESLAFNCPEIFEHVDGTDPIHLTEAQVYAKKAIMRQLAFYKKYFRGFENAYISDIAPMVGVRETRRIRCRYMLNDRDICGKKKFRDHIAKSNYGIDIHGIELDNKELSSAEQGGNFYEIPYFCLVAEGIENLLTAGRCISASFVAQSSLRIQPTVRAIGEAAGIAAAISLKRGIDLSSVRGEEIRMEMVERGAEF